MQRWKKRGWRKKDEERENKRHLLHSGKDNKICIFTSHNFNFYFPFSSSFSSYVFFPVNAKTSQTNFWLIYVLILFSYFFLFLLLLFLSLRHKFKRFFHSLQFNILSSFLVFILSSNFHICRGITLIMFIWMNECMYNHILIDFWRIYLKMLMSVLVQLKYASSSLWLECEKCEWMCFQPTFAPSRSNGCCLFVLVYGILCISCKH